MSNSDFESGFDEIYGDVKENLNNQKGNTSNTGNTKTSSTTGRSQHPFSVRLNEEYIELIKALAWWKRISQREFLESIITLYVEEMEADRLSTILNKYRNDST